MERGNLKYVKGDLLSLFEKGHFDAIAHGCNCQNVMGAGIAKQIKEKYPEAYLADKNMYEKYHKRGLRYLGGFSYVTVPLHKTEKHQKRHKGLIANLYTQLFPGPHFEYIALESSLFHFSNNLVNIQGIARENNGVIKIGLPKIGAGLGGGKWEYIEKVIEEVLDSSVFDITIVEYSPDK